MNETILTRRRQLIYNSDKYKEGEDSIALVGRELKNVTAYGKTEQRNLPYGYTELEYIESTGTQAINTGVKYTGNHFEVEWEAKDNDTSQSTLFACTSVSPYSGGLYGTKSDRKYYIGNGSGMTVNYSSADNAFHKWKIVVSNQTATLYKDGTQVGTASITGTIDTTHNIYLFCGGWTSASIQTLTQFANWDLKYWKLTDNGVVVFNGIPAKDSNNVLGMYDTVSGQFFTNQGTGTFNAGPVVQPTPDAPIDIISNNGVLKARHQSGLPLGYTLLDYIQSSGSQYIDTGISNDNCNGYAVKTKYNYTSLAANSLCGDFESTPYASFGQIYLNNSQSAVYSGVGNVSKCLVSGITSNTDYTDEFTIDCVNGTISRTLNGITYDGSGLSFAQRSPNTCYLFACYRSGAAAQFGSEKIYYFQIFKDNFLVLNLIPAKNSSNVVGMYDLVSGQFFTNQGTGTFTAGNTVSDPVEIYTDGTVETINVHSRNLYNDATKVNGYFISATGVITENALNCYSALIPVKPNTTYVFSGVNGLSNANNKRLHAYDSNGNWLAQLNYVNTDALNYSYRVIGTTTAQTAYVRISFTILDTDIQFEIGSTATDYVPYFDGGTATAEMLLKVGDYQDFQGIIDGVVTRNVGVKVLDGTENIGISGVYYGSLFIRNVVSDWGTSNNAQVYCSHFSGVTEETDYAQNKCMILNNAFNMWWASDRPQTVTQFQQWLADQYNAGTPVIIVYPLATPAYDSVAAGNIHIKRGLNYININYASLEDLKLKVKYK